MATREREKVSWFRRMLGKTDDEFNEFEDIIDDEILNNIGDVDLDGENLLEDDDMFNDKEEATVDLQKNQQQDKGKDLQINLIDKGSDLVAQALVPGTGENKINIDLNREMLTVTAESNEHCFEKEGDYLYEELIYGSFSRSILLPAEVEVEESKAEVKDGVLTITMPKIDKNARKKLQVKRR